MAIINLSGFGDLAPTVALGRKGVIPEAAVQVLSSIALLVPHASQTGTLAPRFSSAVLDPRRTESDPDCASVQIANTSSSAR
jgi:hypothetical protein